MVADMLSWSRRVLSVVSRLASGMKRYLVLIFFHAYKVLLYAFLVSRKR